MMADLEKREDDDHQITFFEVRTSAIVLLSRGLFQDSEKRQERALPPFVASPEDLGIAADAPTLMTHRAARLSALNRYNPL